MPAAQILVRGRQQEALHTASRRAQPRIWLRAVAWLVGAGLHPKANATTTALARDLAARMDYGRGIVLYDLQGTAHRLGLSVPTVKRHAAVLRELGALVWLVHGSKRNLRIPGRKYTATATVYGAVIPPCYDTAMGHIVTGAGYEARISGVTPQGRERAVAEVRLRSGEAGHHAVQAGREPHSLGRTPQSGTVEVSGGVKDTSRKRATRPTTPTSPSKKSPRKPARHGTCGGTHRPARQVARDILITRQVRPLVGWTQTEGLRRLAFSLRPLIDAGLDVHDIAAELHSWYLVWRPARPAAYISAQLHKHGRPSTEPATEPAGGPHLAVAPQDNPAWRAWCESRRTTCSQDEDSAAVRTDEDRAQARLAARYNPHLVLDHIDLHGEDDALDLFGTVLVAQLVGLSHSSHVHLGTG
ncbi:cell wall protein [Streptomyces luteireticuli]|uniref:cell wall protein n=1 Tax=Streptomyces luteireticuli TaxID=173858 RepID=UPI0035583352